MHELEYPSTLGEGNEISVFDENIKYNGCAVITDLIKRGKLKQGFDSFDDNKLKNIISNLNDDQLVLCESSPLCGSIIRKVKTGMYEYDAENELNNICVVYEDEKYNPYEGKHRACIMKNFSKENNMIPVNVEK